MNAPKLFSLSLALTTLCTAALAQSPSQSGTSQKAKQSPLLELYTSQACSICPKANQQFSDFAQSNDVIALTFPVGYWDYLGWTDTFAKPEFSDRQKAYNKAMGRRGPYTPQVIFHGEDHCSATKEKSMERKAVKVARRAAPYSIPIEYDGETVRLSQTPAEEVQVWVVEYIPGETFTRPQGGANKNRDMVYFNRVIDIKEAQPLADNARFAAHRPTSCVAIVQKPDLGEVLGVADHKQDADA